MSGKVRNMNHRCELTCELVSIRMIQATASAALPGNTIQDVSKIKSRVENLFCAVQMKIQSDYFLKKYKLKILVL